VTGIDAASNGPLALVLSGGGARAAYQVGAMRAIAECCPDLQIPILTGVSAGAINTAFLAAHPGPLPAAVDDLAAAWNELYPHQVYRVRPLHIGRSMLRWVTNMLLQRRRGPPALRGLMDMEPLRRFLLRSMDFGGIQRNVVARRLRAVALSATCYNTGQTVTFVEGDESAQLWSRHMRLALRERITADHLLASAAIPIVFPAIKLGNAFYGDGSVRQTAPLAPAIHLGARKILAVAMRSGAEDGARPILNEEYPVAAEIFGMLLHSVFLDTLEADRERLQTINELLAKCASAEPDPRLRPVDLLMLYPSRDLGAMARDETMELPRLVQLLVSSVGGARARSPDFLSYLMFQPSFTGKLRELGYEDTRKRKGEIENFLGG
jgi:NTE family protein